MCKILNSELHTDDTKHVFIYQEGYSCLFCIFYCSLHLLSRHRKILPVEDSLEGALDYLKRIFWDKINNCALYDKPNAELTCWNMQFALASRVRGEI